MTAKFKTQVFYISLFVLSLFFVTRTVLLLPPEDAQLDNGSRLEWTSCWFNIPLFKIIHCARLYPSLQNSQQSISIPVVVIKNKGLIRKREPIIYINGGPGYAVGIDSSYNIDYWVNNVDEYEWNRDFILYDNRGTGLSYPQPQCKELRDINYKNLPKYVTEEEYYHELYEQAKICTQNVREEVNQFNFSTHHSTQDLRDLIDTLNYSSVNLFGVSYGTRVALELMRRSPQRLRSVILDSPFPSSVNNALAWPSVLDNTIQKIFQYCENNKVCQEKYPNLKALFTKALAELKSNPMLVFLPEYYSDGHYEVFINDDRFVYALFTAMYDSSLLPTLPDIINDVVQGKQKSMRQMITIYADTIMDNTANDMVYNFVLCNDNGDITQDALESEINKYPLLKYYNRLEWKYTHCKTVNEDPKLRLSKRPVKSSIPTLILSGVNDTITPWQWGEEINQHLENSSHYIVKEISHGVIGFDECALEISRLFLKEPNNLSKQKCSTFINSSSALQVK